MDNCEIGPSTISDHGPIYMSVHLNNNKKSTLWRLNSNTLNNPVIKDELKNEIKLYLDNNDNEEMTPPILWYALKVVIRGKIIAISSYDKKIREQKLQKLEEDLTRLQKEQAKSPKDDNKSKIIKLKKEID